MFLPQQEVKARAVAWPEVTEMGIARMTDGKAMDSRSRERQNQVHVQ